jgi:hemerythrin-like domain-containing protein
MLHPIEILMDEHRTVESVLDSLCLFAQTTLETAADDRGVLAQFVALLRMFDELHHLKEENMLFDRMEKCGFPRNNGPLAVMLMEHSTCRELVGRLAALAEQPAVWTDQERTALNETATEYTLFLKGHIAKEDNVLYPMSRQALPEPEWEALADAFTEFESDWSRSGRLADFRERVERLREAWPAEDGPAPAGGCGVG